MSPMRPQMELKLTILFLIQIDNHITLALT